LRVFRPGKADFRGTPLEKGTHHVQALTKGQLMRRRDPAAAVFSEIEALQTHRELAASLAQKEGALAPMSSTAARRVLVLLGNRALESAMKSELETAGFETRTVGDFKQLVSWLLLASRPVTVIFQPPRVDVLRKAMLRELKRFAPSACLIAMVPSVAPEQVEIELGAGARVLAQDAPVGAIVDAVRTPG
jgi:hypothetical protein